jgi:transcriptional regulator CtsR
MDLYGGKGRDVGSYRGGEGGFSRIRFTMLRNTEYVIAGLTEAINTPFVYRKGQLIACVG